MNDDQKMIYYRKKLEKKLDSKTIDYISNIARVYDNVLLTHTIKVKAKFNGKYKVSLITEDNVIVKTDIFCNVSEVSKHVRHLKYVYVIKEVINETNLMLS